jgi:DNA polymerase-3 subunit delta
MEKKQVHYFYGKDIAGVTENVKALLKKLMKSKGEYTKIEGSELDLDDFSAITQTYSMFSDTNCIVVKDFNAEQLDSDGLKRMLAVIENVPEITTVIFSITGINIYNAQNKLIEKNKKLIDLIEKVGFVYEMQPKTHGELVKFVTQKVVAKGCSIGNREATEIVTLCMDDKMLINNEVDKLCAFVGNGEITMQTVTNVVSKTMEMTVFVLTDAIRAKNTQRALETLDALLRQNNEPIALLALISASFIDLMRAKAAQNSARTNTDIAKDFGTNPYVVTKALSACRSISSENLRECTEILRKTELALKTRSDTAGTSRVLLEETIIKMVRKMRDYGG